MYADVITTFDYNNHKVLTVAGLKDNGIGLVEARRMAAEAWQQFENDAAGEENRKPAHITAKRQTWNNEYASFVIFEDGEITEIETVMVEDKYGDVTAELAHFVLADYC